MSLHITASFGFHFFITQSKRELSWVKRRDQGLYHGLTLGDVGPPYTSQEEM
jgi:hypothetical protein